MGYILEKVDVIWLDCDEQGAELIENAPQETIDSVTSLAKIIIQ